MIFDDFRTTDFTHILSLPGNTAPLWGSMTLHHMVEHLADTVQMSNGTIFLQVFTPADKLERIKAIGLLSDRELAREFKSPVIPGELIPYRTENLQAAVALLKAEMEKFEAYYAANKDRTENHPVFGSLTYPEWLIFHNKHFTHHLKQFGLK